MTTPAPLARFRGAGVLAVGAHPDDLEVGAGGALAKLSAAGARVVMAIVSLPNNADRRAEEARRAAEILGCELRLLSRLQRHVEDIKSYELVAALDALVAELQPELVIAHASCDPHRDHFLAGAAARSTQRLGHFDFWRYATTERPTPSAGFHPSLFVDVSSTIELKLQAIAAHRSQFAERGRGTDFARALAKDRGRLAGVAYAEAFEPERLTLS